MNSKRFLSACSEAAVDVVWVCLKVAVMVSSLRILVLKHIDISLEITQLGLQCLEL